MARLASALPVVRDPLLPLVWALRWVVGDKEKFPAQLAATPLRLEQSQAEVVQWWGCRSPSPTGPVLGQGRVIRRRPRLDHLVSDDLRPGVLDAGRRRWGGRRTPSSLAWTC